MLTRICRMLSACGLVSFVALSANAADEFPLTGAVTTSVGFNHAYFRDLGESDADSGWTRGTLQGSVFYTPISVPDLTFTGTLTVIKDLDEGARRAPFNGTTTPGTAEMRDVSLGANYIIGKTGPLMWIGTFATSLPTSKFAEALDIYSAFSPGIGFVASAPGGVMFQLFGDVTYNWVGSPTQQVDCRRNPSYCEVSGGDLGNPNFAWNYSGFAAVVWRAYPGLLFTGGYFILGGTNAYEAPNDEFTAPLAGIQTGTQLQSALHQGFLRVQYGFQQPGGGANQAMQDLSGDAAEDSILNHLVFRFQMSAVQSVFSADGQRLTNPWWDTETGTLERVQYMLTLQYVI